MTVLPFGAILPGSEADPTLPLRRVEPTTTSVPALTGTAGAATWAAPRPGRRPAPILLRAFVWVLSLAFCLAMLGDVAVRLEPNVFPHFTPPLQAAGGVPATRPVAAQATPRPFQLVGTSAGTTTYALSATRYEIGVLVSQRAWVVIAPVADPHAPVVASVLEPSPSVQWFSVSGASTVSIAARIAKLEVRSSAGAVLGQVTAPLLEPHDYLFRPAG